MGLFLDLNCQVSNHREGASKLETGRVILRLTIGLIIKARHAISAEAQGRRVQRRPERSSSDGANGDGGEHAKPTALPSDVAFQLAAAEMLSCSTLMPIAKWMRTHPVVSPLKILKSGRPLSQWGYTYVLPCAIRSVSPTMVTKAFPRR